MLDSKSGLQMSINSDHYVKLIDTIILGIKRKQNVRQSIFLAKLKDNFQIKTANISRKKL
jgi:hypothetical protein